ncbi:uncharacterized protein METZ01_LOCUS33344 [marine metagenome]|uniref:Cation efflux protein transmembrane domain-containing protein n=1 Tax=marine metagenome TaxID=408172 RepID=A0A381QN73_9ZZZZ
MHAHIGPETDAQLSHGYSRGTVDGDILANNQGIWAAKTSLAVLLATAVVRLMIVGFTGSAALLADTIYNYGGSATAIPLREAFTLFCRLPTKCFNYGDGRAEGLAGLLIVLSVGHRG